MRYSFGILILGLFLAACGGGGGGDPSSQLSGGGSGPNGPGGGAIPASWGMITGTVVTADQQPQPNVHVRAISNIDSTIQIGRFTDRNGAYTLEVPTGSYHVVAENIDGRAGVTRNRISNGVVSAVPEFPDEFFSGADETGADDPQLRSVVSVIENDVTTAIDFVLNTGAPASGPNLGIGDITQIAVGDTVSGFLGEPGDFTDDVGLGVYVDYYVFTGVAGQRIEIVLGSAEFDTVLIVSGGGTSISNDDSGGSTDSFLSFTVTSTGQFVIAVTSFASGQTGNYTLAVGEADPVPLLPFGTPPTVGELSVDDDVVDGTFFDTYEFSAQAGTPVTLELSATQFDTFLIMISPGGLVFVNDDIDREAGNFNSRLPGTLPESGTYTVLVTSAVPGETGPYQILLTSP